MSDRELMTAGALAAVAVIYLFIWIAGGCKRPRDML